MRDKQDFKDGLKVDNYNLAPDLKITDTAGADIYQEFVLKQKTPFLEYLNYLNELLIILKDYRIVSDYTQLSARIKSTESAVKNDNTKALNDVFGIEIDFATPGEEAFIIVIIKKTLNKTKENVHNKANGYIAHHYSGYPAFLQESNKKLIQTDLEEYNPRKMIEEYFENLSEKSIEKLTEEQIVELKAYFTTYADNLRKYTDTINNYLTKQEILNLNKSLLALEKSYKKSIKGQPSEYIPIIECQFKTIQVAIEANIGSASHGDYKGVNMTEIQKEYNSPNGIPLSRIPIMFYSELKRNANGEVVEPKQLSSDETLRKLYPSLRTNNNIKMQGTNR